MWTTPSRRWRWTGRWWIGATIAAISPPPSDPSRWTRAWCRVEDGEASLVRIHQVNTRKLIHARFPVRDGRAEVRGDFAIAGVAGTGARIRLDFLAPGGTQTGALLPTGKAVDVLEIDGLGPLRATLVDAANPAVFVAAADLGLSGAESPDAMEGDAALMALLDRVRRAAGVAMGLGATPEAVGLGQPARRRRRGAARRPHPGRAGARSRRARRDGAGCCPMGRPHRAVPMTGAMALAVACRIEGSVPHAAGGAAAAARPEEIRVAHPSGTLTVGAEVRRDAAAPAGTPRARSCSAPRAG